MATLVRILFCLSLVGVLLYRYIDLQNQLTLVRLEIPVVAKELRASLERNQSLRFELDRFASPQHLMELWGQPRYSHLHFPVEQEVLVITHTRSDSSSQRSTAALAGVEQLIAEAPLSGG